MDICYPEWMNESQKKCYRMLCDLVGGQHHIRRKVEPTCERGIQVNVTTDWATFDSGELTRLVVLAHDRGIRASLEPVNMQYMRLCLDARDGRTGRFYARHPTLEKHVAALHECYPTGDNMPDELAAELRAALEGESC